jgi:hypothetical protein
MSKHHNPEPALVLADSYGIYIPQRFCADITQEEAQLMCVDWEDVQTCQAGPDHEWYWEAWDCILQSASFTDENGTTWTLHQDGDLWEIPEGFEFPECC